MDLIFIGMKFNKTIPHCKMSVIGIVTVTQAFSFSSNFLLLKDLIATRFSSHPFHLQRTTFFMSSVFLMSHPALSHS